MSQGTTVAASSRATARITAGGRQHPPHEGHRQYADHHGDAERRDDPDDQVLQRVDILDDPGQQVAPAERRAGRPAPAARAAGRPGPGGRRAAGRRRRGRPAAPRSGRARGTARRTGRPTMATASGDSLGCWAALEISQAAVPMSPMSAAMAPAPSRVAEHQAPGGRPGQPRVRPKRGHGPVPVPARDPARRRSPEGRLDAVPAPGGPPGRPAPAGRAGGPR